MKLKDLLANKNVVTILGAVLIVIVLYAFYMWRVNSAINPISVPYAKQEITSRTLITNYMVGSIEIPSSMVSSSKNIVTAPSNVITRLPASTVNSITSSDFDLLSTFINSSVSRFNFIGLSHSYMSNKLSFNSR